MTAHGSLEDCAYIWQEQEEREIEFLPSCLH